MNFLRALTAVSCAAVLALPALAQDAPRRLEAVETGNSSSCLKLLMPGDEGTGNFGGFRNTCDQTMEYTHCVVGPKDGSWGSTAACEVGKPNVGMDRVGPGQVSSAHVTGGTRVAWFACAFTQKSGEGPDGIWGSAVFDGVTLKGRCKYNRYVTEAVKQPAEPLKTPASPNTTPASSDIAALRAAAEAGDSAAQFRLAQTLAKGDGAARDPARALELFHKAADGGKAYAEIAYGTQLYRMNRKAEAAKYLEKTAREGNGAPQFLYAQMLWDGDGVAQNRALARAYMEKAAAQGIDAAKRQLAMWGGGAAQPAPVMPKQLDYAPRTGQVGSPSGVAETLWAACLPETQKVVELERAGAMNFVPKSLEQYHNALKSEEAVWLGLSREKLELRLKGNVTFLESIPSKPLSYWSSMPGLQEPEKQRGIAYTQRAICLDRKMMELRGWASAPAKIPAGRGKDFQKLVTAACANESSEYVESYNARGPGARGVGEPPKTLQGFNETFFARDDWATMPLDRLQVSVGNYEYELSEALKRKTQWPQNDRFDVASARVIYCEHRSWLSLRQ